MGKIIWVLALGGLLQAHPMGNFSVNHYARIEVGQPYTRVLFVLDLAELPSFELLQRWGLQGSSPREELTKKAAAESKRWMRDLRFVANEKRVVPVWESVAVAVTEGAGSLPVLRISTRLKVAAEPGTLRYEDKTYPDRTAGWKEVVLGRAADKSQELAAYPQDPTVAPPQDLTAEVTWKGVPVVTRDVKPVPAPVVVPEAAPVTVTAPTVVEPNSGGQVRRGDFLSNTLKGKEIGWGLGFICVAVAFWFGALHALEPGHGKTMVAAYLVGERGTPRHAVLLGAMVTFTHTVSVFALGLATMFLSRYVMADVLSKWLGVISGLTIVWIGGLLLYRRTRKQEHQHSHPHPHPHVQEEISMKSLMALGASGGLVPCPSALVLLLAAVSVGRIGFGLLLLVSFSLGLALVLMGTGLVVLYVQRFMPARKNQKRGALASSLPIVSAVVITVIGIVLTGNALGLIPPIRFFG